MPHAAVSRLAGAILLPLLALALGGCSGGGDGTPSNTLPNAPQLNLDYAAIKTFRFTWPDVDGETEYRLLENPDGGSGFTVVATLPADTTTHDLEVSLPARLNAQYLLQACNADGCTDSGTVTVDVARLADAIGYVKASNTGAGDRFGYPVALSADGNTLAVSAFYEDSNATGIGGNQNNDDASDSGAVYVFVRAGGAWSQQAYVKASNTGNNDYFGYTLALSDDGDTLAVGAPFEDTTANSSGAVYVFTRSGATWSQQAFVKASNTGQDDLFGSYVALSADGDTLAVGAPDEDSDATGIGGTDNDNTINSGAVYVFTRSGATWSQQAYVKASNTGAGDRFGYALALSGDGSTLAVGAFYEDSDATGIGGDQTNGNATNSGAVYLY